MRRRPPRSRAARAAGLALCGVVTQAPAPTAEPVRFALWGDAPYRESERPLVPRLVEEVGPVVVLHGDTHVFRRDRPLADPATGRPVPNVVRVETYGSPLVGWVEVTVDPAAPEPVRAEPHLVAAGG